MNVAVVEKVKPLKDPVVELADIGSHQEAFGMLHSGQTIKLPGGGQIAIKKGLITITGPVNLEELASINNTRLRFFGIPSTGKYAEYNGGLVIKSIQQKVSHEDALRLGRDRQANGRLPDEKHLALTLFAMQFDDEIARFINVSRQWYPHLGCDVLTRSGYVHTATRSNSSIVYTVQESAREGAKRPFILTED